MLKKYYKGYTIEITLPEECGYKNYSVECTYKYNKEREKYLLSMWLKYKGDKNKFRIELQEIDSQFITATKETIINNIIKIVEHASLSGFFDKYIQQYEYTYKCFCKGKNFLEKERETYDTN